MPKALIPHTIEAHDAIVVRHPDPEMVQQRGAHGSHPCLARTPHLPCRKLRHEDLSAIGLPDRAGDAQSAAGQAPGFSLLTHAATGGKPSSSFASSASRAAIALLRIVGDLTTPTSMALACR
jgi:hypothetical protein